MPIEIPDDWAEEERGNTWLMDSEGGSHIGYFDLPGGHLMEVEVTPANYPGFNPRVVKGEDKLKVLRHLADLVHNRGWAVRKNNLGDIPVPHIRVEYDPNYTGGDYSGVGQHLFLPLKSVDDVGVEEAFTKATGLPDYHIVHWSDGELYDGEGKRLDE